MGRSSVKYCPIAENLLALANVTVFAITCLIDTALMQLLTEMRKTWGDAFVSYFLSLENKLLMVVANEWSRDLNHVVVPVLPKLTDKLYDNRFLDWWINSRTRQFPIQHFRLTFFGCWYFYNRVWAASLSVSCGFSADVPFNFLCR